MKQYIDKDALIADINKGINGRDDWQLDDYRKGYHDALIMFKKYLSILKVEEVDLEKEIADIYEANYEEYLTYEEFADIAKHFFELGLDAQHKISYVPNIEDSLKELGVDPSSKEAKIFKESYCAALDKLLEQKGE